MSAFHHYNYDTDTIQKYEDKFDGDFMVKQRIRAAKALMEYNSSTNKNWDSLTNGTGGLDRKTLHKFIHQNTAPDTEAIYTDEWPPYRGVGKNGTRHQTVNHKAEQWVNGKVHTNTVENVWSLLKRSIIGAYHKVSVKHLDSYLDELEFRYNNRKNEWAFRDAMIKLVSSDKLTYEKLTNGTKKETSHGVENASCNPAALSQKSD
jgi:IS1 family transposase